MSVRDDTSVPCGWAPSSDALYRSYHDTEWGVPERDPVKLFAKLQLDGMQAGLSWITILRKREAILAEFEGFDPVRLVEWTDERIAQAMQNPGIIRSPKKAEATVGNARAFLRMADQDEDFADHCWSFVGGQPLVNGWQGFRDAPVKTPESEALSKDLKKRGFKFCGPVIVYAFMQAVGMVNDHEIGCPRHREVRAL